MKIKYITLILVFAVFLAGCGFQQKTERTIDKTFSGKEIEVAVGDSFVVSLDSNPTTGFEWALAENSDEDVLQKVDSEFEAAKTDLIGAGGKELWTFKALKEGTSTISMEYRRSWEEEIEPAETFGLTVVVQ